MNHAVPPRFVGRVARRYSQRCLQSECNPRMVPEAEAHFELIRPQRQIRAVNEEIEEPVRQDSCSYEDHAPIPGCPALPQMIRDRGNR